MVYTFSVSLPIPPELSKLQVWMGINLKARQPKLFNPGITRARVLSEQPSGLVREIEINGVRETEIVEFFEPCLIFRKNSGTVIHYIISDSMAGTPPIMTFVFMCRFPGVVEGSVEETAKGEQAKGLAVSLPATLDKIRNLVRDGVIKS
ncbi:hypothetical protein SISSUDRAFT_1121133 [Sistotremastrum suecicum HHB10207 ss-3]|uniref:DUF1857-domain-containing protein n=1 Tax=Sistotremastrum suecicum HHB10207 ss-3 TaxID=1314776 RepID=A0A166BA15_9AGAM|nr:hypothetical protein SISSUDRAFT_1121133 [Sistotremastrum suecicum HHB10207 ss-3]